MHTDKLDVEEVKSENDEDDEEVQTVRERPTEVRWLGWIFMNRVQHER